MAVKWRWITLTSSLVGRRRVRPPIHNSFTISRIKLTYTDPRTAAYATSEEDIVICHFIRRHAALCGSLSKGKLRPVYTTVKIEPSHKETKKVLTFLEVLQHFSERHHNELELRGASCCEILHNMVMLKAIVHQKRLC